MSFEHHLCHRNERDESVLTGCHLKELFSVSIVRLPDVYQLVAAFWNELGNMHPVYPTANLMIYAYFA